MCNYLTYTCVWDWTLLFIVQHEYYNRQSLVIKLVIAQGHNLTQYLFIGGEFDKSTIGLHLLLISSMLTKFLEN